MLRGTLVSMHAPLGVQSDVRFCTLTVSSDPKLLRSCFVVQVHKRPTLLRSLTGLRIVQTSGFHLRKDQPNCSGA